MTGISSNLNFITTKGCKLVINHSILFSQLIDLFVSSFQNLIYKKIKVPLYNTTQDKKRQCNTIQGNAMQCKTIWKKSRTKNNNKQINKILKWQRNFKKPKLYKFSRVFTPVYCWVLFCLFCCCFSLKRDLSKQEKVSVRGNTRGILGWVCSAGWP